MTAARLLEGLREEGFTLSLEDDRLTAQPASRLSARQRSEIRYHARELREALTQEKDYRDILDLADGLWQRAWALDEERHDTRASEWVTWRTHHLLRPEAEGSVESVTKLARLLMAQLASGTWEREGSTHRPSGKPRP